jgi:hypothetical protein
VTIARGTPAANQASIRVLYIRATGASLDRLYPGFDDRFDTHVDPNNPEAEIAIRRGFSCAAAGS